MAIKNTTPVTIQATEQTTYDSYWASRIIIDSPAPNQKSRAIIELKPYSQTSKKVLDQKKLIRLDDVFESATSTPEVAEALTAILKAIEVLAKIQ